MTEITAPKSPVTAEQFADEIREQLKYTQNVTTEQATPADVYVAASKAVRNHLADSWFKTQADTVNGNTKAVGYLSAEFLMGKQLRNALLNAGLTEQFDKAVEALGFKVQDVVDAEYEPGLGNGGLGRLAACFIDSLASLGVPAFGYGIQYKYGIFKQEFDKDGKQVETPDYWLANEEPWGHIDYNRDQKVSFGGEVVEENGKKVWKPAWSVRAVPVDYMVPGYASGRVNTLRLWTAKSYDEFDLLTFNKSEYLDAVKPQVEAENISKILYPEDSTPQGKALRLEQQYFFVSASIHDAIRVFYPGQDKPDLTTFPDKITFQLNDTHPVIGIPELMRVLMDEYGYDWDTAWKFTNVTNGVTPRRFIKLANPRLSDLITEGLGTDKWLSDLELLKGLIPLADDDEFVKKFAAVKQANKVDFSNFAKRKYGFDIDPNTMINTMVKRLHEYKRQALKILSVIADYADIKSGKVSADDIMPRTIVFGAKAAPGYYLAKQTIQLINNVARVINNDPDVKGKLNVYFPWNYNIELAMNLIPATDLDEQISQAGKEASGTGNMKFALNGALTVGTLDGANVEIRERVGAENFFLFGMTEPEVSALYAKGYDTKGLSREYYEKDPQLKAAIDMVADGTFSDGDKDTYKDLVNDWLNKDYFMTLADFRAYMDIQAQIEETYRDPMKWSRMAVLNVANSGYFSSDRSIEDYLERIWHTGPLK